MELIYSKESKKGFVSQINVLTVDPTTTISKNQAFFAYSQKKLSQAIVDKMDMSNFNVRETTSEDGGTFRWLEPK